jgi:hypothetical protein
MSFRNRFLGGVSSIAFNVPDGGGGGGGGTPPAATPPARVETPATPPAATPPAATAPATPPAATPPSAPPAKAAATLAGGQTPGETPAIAAVAKWPDDWREQLAGDDKAFLNQLKRYDSPQAFAKSNRELRLKVDSGELKPRLTPPAEGAKPEEVAAWRKENGLPENPGAFVAALKLPDGVIPGKADEPLLASFADVAMNSNWDQATYNPAVDWYYKMSDQLTAQRDQQDGTFFQDSMRSLMQEWGPKEFPGNQQAIVNFMQLFPEDIRDNVLTARTADGRMLGDHPLFNRAILMMAKEMNPASTILPAAAGGGLAAVDTRIAEIEGIMKNPATQDQYWRGPSGEKMQEEYRQLLGARETMQKRQAAA